MSTDVETFPPKKRVLLSVTGEHGRIHAAAIRRSRPEKTPGAAIREEAQDVQDLSLDAGRRRQTRRSTNIRSIWPVAARLVLDALIHIKNDIDSSLTFRRRAAKASAALAR